MVGDNVGEQVVKAGAGSCAFSDITLVGRRQMISRKRG